MAVLPSELEIIEYARSLTLQDWPYGSLTAKRQRNEESISEDDMPPKSARSDPDIRVEDAPVPVPALVLDAPLDLAPDNNAPVDNQPEAQAGEMEEGELAENAEDVAGPSNRNSNPEPLRPREDTSGDNALATALQEAEISALLYNTDGVTPKADLRKDTAPVNVRQKEQVLTAIANVIAGCHKDLGVPLADVYTGCVIYSHMMNVWAIIRQVLGGVRPVTSLQNVKSAEIQILHDGVTKETDLFTEIKRFLRSLANVGLEVNPERIARDDRNSWIGTAAAFCDFMGGFGLRLKEMRTGVSQVTFGYNKMDNMQKRPKIVELIDYGWTTAHHPLCEMITFPPEKQGSMARTVGPLTRQMATCMLDNLCSRAQYCRNT